MEPEPRADVAPPPCPRCGTLPEDRYQEYCLECGSRLVRYPAQTSFFRRDAWARQSPLWMWLPLLALLLLALLLTGIVVWAASDGDEGARQARPATNGAISIVTGPTTFAPPVSTFTATTLPTTTFATTTIPTTTATATTTTTVADDVIAWPSRDRGYTIVLASIPRARGRDAADRKANEAIDRGLSEVGVLDSSQYSSLTAGYYVVFTGVYDTQQEAENGLSGARAANYPLAYVREVRP